MRDSLTDLVCLYALTLASVGAAIVVGVTSSWTLMIRFQTVSHALKAAFL